VSEPLLPSSAASAPAPPSSRVDTVIDRFTAVPHQAGRPYGEGLYRRRMRFVNTSTTHTIGELEDDFHHFRIELEHDGERIVRADGYHYRAPWSTCAEAPGPLRAIEGQPLSPRSTAVGAYTKARHNCTHLFDLAGLAVAHAVRGVGAERQYDIVITDPVGPTAEQTCRLWRDGAHILTWRLEHREIVEPAEWAGAPLRVKFIDWAEARYDPDLTEAAIALRRVVDIAIGRQGDLDRFDRGEDTRGNMDPVCHTYQHVNLIRARRQKGSARDFLSHPELLLADMHLRDGDTGTGTGTPRPAETAP
jgi:hypothetical protein